MGKGVKGEGDLNNRLIPVRAVKSLRDGKRTTEDENVGEAKVGQRNSHEKAVSHGLGAKTDHPDLRVGVNEFDRLSMERKEFRLEETGGGKKVRQSDSPGRKRSKRGERGN